MVGYVYKITSPSGRIYVGSTTDIRRRKWAYNSNSSGFKQQPKLYNSIKKYGLDKHLFEILWEGNPEERLIKEFEFGHALNVLDKDIGLNLRLPNLDDKVPCYSKEALLRKSISQTFPKPWNGKVVSVYDLEGNYLMTFPSAAEAGRYYGIQRSYVRKVMIGRCHRYKNVTFRYGDNKENIESTPKIVRKPSKNGKQVGRHDKEGNLLEVLPAVNHYVDKYGYNQAAICTNILGNSKTSYGFIWKYI